MWRELVLLPVLFVLVQSQGGTIFHCPDDKGPKTFDLQCPGDTVIHIKEAIYGRNQWGACLYTTNDCVEKVNLTSECCGRQSCSVTVWRIYSINCTYVTFFRLIYECVTREIASCGNPYGLILTSPSVHRSTESARTVQVTSSPGLLPNRPEVTQRQEVDNSENVLIIVISAATVAFLLVAIIAVVFLLKRFHWQAEKQCILEFFIGMCKRHPPDGCENPDEEAGRPSANQPKSESNTGSNSKNTNINNNNKMKLSKQQRELMLKVVDKTLESEKILQEQNQRFCIPDIIPRKPKSILKNDTNKTKTVRINTDASDDISEFSSSRDTDEIDLTKYRIYSQEAEPNGTNISQDEVKSETVITENTTGVVEGNKENKIKNVKVVTINEGSEDIAHGNIENGEKGSKTVLTEDEGEKTGSKDNMSENEHTGSGRTTNPEETENTETESIEIVKNKIVPKDDNVKCKNLTKINDERTDLDRQFDYDGGVVVVDDLQLSRLRSDISVENLYGVGVERSNSYSSPMNYKNGNIVYYTDKVRQCRPKLLQRFGTRGTEVNCADSRTFRDITNSVVSEEPGTTAV